MHIYEKRMKSLATADAELKALIPTIDVRKALDDCTVVFTLADEITPEQAAIVIGYDLCEICEVSPEEIEPW